MLDESEKTMVVLMFKSNIQKQSVLIFFNKLMVLFRRKALNWLKVKTLTI